jgi:hypothetical protein
MRLIIYTVLFALVVIYALVRGGGPERLFASILTAMLVVDRVGHAVLGETSRSAINGLHFVIDLGSFAAMMAVMIWSRRFWPIWACSLQLLSLASHVTRMLDARLPPVITAILGIAPNYLICVCLMLGTVLHRLRLRRRGSDPSWRSSWPLATGRMRPGMPISF